MPPSAQRRRTRKQPDMAEKSEPEDFEESVTPNRKRRRTNNNLAVVATPSDASNAPRAVDAANRKKEAQSNIKVFEDQESSFTEEDVDNVIRSLREAKYNIAARLDYSNEVQEIRNPQGKTAYAKIAGNGWTFYVDELEVRIGRPPDEKQADNNGDTQSREASLDKSLVHIDLGPSKLVSRQHAEIRFDNHSGSWYIAVNGRNGIKLDERPLNRGQSATLQSGTVIEIAGTQMMFVTPNDVPQIHPSILAQSHAAQEDDEDEDEMDDAMRPPQAVPHRTPTRGAGPRSGGQRPPSSANPSTNSQRQSQRGHQMNEFAQHDGSTDVPSSVMRSRGSPTFSRGLMLETAEDVDYSIDTAKDLKPPHSYAQLIGMAILSTEEEKLTLSKIYDWIKERYAFYRFSNGGWQNSIRHNLSLNKSFEKVARRTDEPGKGMKWQIAPEHREEFIKKGLNGARRPTGRTSSVPNSPSKEPSSVDARGIEPGEGDAKDMPEPRKTPVPSYGLKNSPGSTPPVSHYPQAKQAYTPDRGITGFGRGPFDGSSPTKGLGMGISPFPFSVKGRERWSGLTDTAIASTPGGPRIPFGSEPQEPNLVTPLITKQAPKLAPPSTARLPSHYMPMSSPAPFWKYAEFSTPAKPLTTSPIKTELKMEMNGKKEESSGDEKANDFKHLEHTGEPVVRSSSPPLPEGEVGQESPTRAASQRGNEHKLVAPPQVALQPGRTQSPRATVKGLTGSAARPPAREAEDENDDDDDDDEGEGGMIDLARGFQPIGSFHRNMSTGVVGRN